MVVGLSIVNVFFVTNRASMKEFGNAAVSMRAPPGDRPAAGRMSVRIPVCWDGCPEPPVDLKSGFLRWILQITKTHQRDPKGVDLQIFWLISLPKPPKTRPNQWVLGGFSIGLLGFERFCWLSLLRGHLKWCFKRVARPMFHVRPKRGQVTSVSD